MSAMSDLILLCLVFAFVIATLARARAVRAHEETTLKYRRFQHWAQGRRSER